MAILLHLPEELKKHVLQAWVELSALLPEQSERVAEEGMTDIGRLTQIMRRLPRETPVRLVEVASVIMDCDLDAQFTFGLDLMLTSLKARRGETQK